ncbi:putative methyl-accepting chemotaxis protein (MCP) [Magnetospirillum sp. XM-1]|uniref:hypothetical protein n=1 Tax=Magnetospirillum sp. XM-1 TaxID=1663591 RepID=UPI00073E0620|nr:hypothetical protein [Magnetospirillum sp. XM-1]CUW39578.1 putative methyl-accepting chemotaxis protein (MCP) [Magnetospirillum sp. XM-1]
MNAPDLLTGRLPERLRRLAGALDELHAPAERAFIAYGTVLSRAVTVLRTVEEDLEGLRDQLSATQSVEATRQITDAVQQIVVLAARGGDGSVRIESLAEQTRMVAIQVEILRKIVGEVGLLSMNGKVQAAYLAESGQDFSVFTVEIAKLGELALASIDQTASRLVQLRQTIDETRNETIELERRNARELDSIQARLQDGLGNMARHRDDAGRTVADVTLRSAEVARRIAAAIGEMQINDIASQRIAHVSSALTTLAGMLPPAEGDAAPDLSMSDPAEDESRMVALAGTVLRLQAAQLQRTRDEFCGRVDSLAALMRGLADDARQVSSLAVETFAGGQTSGNASFVGDLGRDMAAAKALLTQTDEARRTLKRLVEGMAAEFSSMAADLQAIQSIDADMRVMGLNATLKCGRLGPRGLALGVVAHELRGCSRRTEEQARRLAGPLAEAMKTAEALAQSSDTDVESLSRAAMEAMEASLTALTGLGDAVDGSFSRLRSEIDMVAGELADIGQSMEVGHLVGKTLERVSAEVEALADEVDPGRSDPSHVRDEMERLLRAHYTMDSERMVHDLFADEIGTEPVEKTGSPADAAADLDDCFL